MKILPHEKRMHVIFNFLYKKEGGLLRRYKAPEHLCDDALRDELNELVEDINQLIPSDYTQGDWDLLLPKINAAIRRRHGAQGWPSAKVFIAAAEDAVVTAAKRKAATAPISTKWNLDPLEINVRRMLAGEEVGEEYIWGRQSVELLSLGRINQATIDAYRSGAFLKQLEQNGERAAIQWEEKANARHKAAIEERQAKENEQRPICGAAAGQTRGHLDSVAQAMERRAQQMRRPA